MSEQRMAAIFYVRLPDGAAPPSLEDLATCAGLERILLDESNPALLYLDTELAEHFPAAYRTGRDSLPISHGLLLFRGTGDRRWW